jgi:hypothetical protein
MARIFLAFAFLAFFPLSTQASPRDPALGTITNPAFSFKFGGSPGTDLFDLSGTYVPAEGAPAFNLPADVVTLSFDGGRFTQTLPSNTFACNANSCSFSNSGGAGITNFVIRTNGTFTIAVRRSDFTGTNPAQMGVVSFTVGDNVFSLAPNSPPVGKITGSASAAVGDLLTFDATESTDFNSNPLTYTWSIVSQPLGSSAALTSTTNATTSLTVTTNGAYVVKVLPNDGTIDGIPALFTVNVTGGPADPAPTPGPDNGLIVLSSDLNSYLVGQTATLSLHVNVPDGNSQRRYVFSATYDDQPITLTEVTPTTDFTFVTPEFTEPGTHTLKVLQYTETTDLANDLTKAITNYNNDILKIQRALEYETDPALISQLQAQIAFDQAQIAIDQQKLMDNRTQVAGPAVLPVIAN